MAKATAWLPPLASTPDQVLLLAWFTVSSVVPPPALVSVIVPPAPPREGSVMLLPLRSRLPPPMVNPAPPSAAGLPSCSRPALSVVPPLKVLLPARSSTPLPIFVMPPLPVRMPE